MADDLLVGIGIDVAAFRRDRAIILAEAQGLQHDIARTLQGTPILPDFGAQARTAGQSVITGLREAIQGGSDALRRDVGTALVPRSLATDVAGLRNVVRSGITGISEDFSSEGADSAAAFLASLDRGLADARAVFAGFAKQVSGALSGTTGILGDLTPEAEAAGRQLVTGLQRSIQRDAGVLRTELQSALVPPDLSASFGPLLRGVQDVTTTIVATLGAGGRDAGRALTSGLAAELVTADAAVGRFVISASARLSNANLLSGLAAQGEREGALLVSGVVTAITGNAGEIERAVALALVPASLPTELRALTAAVATETARLVPILSSTGTEAARGLIGALTKELTSGAGTAVTVFARGAQTAVAGTNLIGDVTAVGERAGVQLSTGVQVALAREATSLRGAVGTALVPQNLTTEIGRLEGSITSALAQFPALFRTTGAEAGGALVAGLTGQLTSGRQLLTGFAQETSRALTAALTIGDTSASGERAGRLLASSVATGIAAESGVVREALAASLSPAGLTQDVARITETVVAEARTLAPQLAQEGTKAGEAYIGAIEGVVSRGAGALKQLTAGATIGVVVDTAPILAATRAEQELAAAAKLAADALTQAGAATATLNPEPIVAATTATRTLAEAQREWLKDAQGASIAAQGAWQRQREAAFQAGQEAKRNSAQATRDAAQEVAARAQVLAELANEIATLAAYGRTVNATSAEAVAGWRAEAAAIRQQAVEVGLSRDGMFRLDDAIRRTERSFARQQAAAERAAAATAANAAAGIGTGVGNIGADLNVLARQANAAKRSVDQVTLGGRSLQSTMNRLGPVVVGVGFGLEALARGGASADAGLRTALRSIASFAAFFGGPGLIVAGIAAASAAILDLFTSTRDEIRKTEEQFRSSVNEMIKSGDVKGLRDKFKEIDKGLPDINKGGRLTGGVVELSRELENAQKQVITLKELLQSGGGGQPFAVALSLTQAIINARGLKEQLIAAQTHSEQIAKLFAQPTKEIQAGLDREKADAAKKAAEDAAKALRDQAAQIGVVQEALGRANDNATLHANIIRTAIPLYDSIRKQATAHKDQVSETANELAKMLRRLTDIDAVSIELTRRKLGGVVPNVAPVHVTGIIDQFTVPAATKIDVPVDFDVSKLSDSLRRAIEGVTAAQNQQVFAEIFGSQQQVAQATRTVDTLIGNLTRTFRAAVDAELASADSDLVKAQRIRGISAAAHDLGIDLLDSTRNANGLTQELSAIGDAIRGIATAADAMHAFDNSILDTIESAARLADSIADIADLSSSLKANKKGGLFDSFTNILKGIPKIGEAIAAAVQLGRSAFNAVTGSETKSENAAILKQNNEELAKLGQDLRGFGDRVGDLLGASRAISTSSILQARAGTSGFGRGFQDVEGLDKELRAAGSSIAELKRRAQELGITIVDAKGRISAQGLDALNQALLLTVKNLITFKNTLEDQSFIATARRDILDQTDAQSVAKDWLTQLKQFAPDIARKFFAGADAATQNGRAIFEQGLRDAFEAAAANKIDPEVIKAFGGIKEFVNFLLDADHALDSFSDTTKQATGEMVNVVSGFKTWNKDLARFNATAVDVRALRGPIPRPSPTPIPVGAFATSAMSVGQVVFSPTIKIDGRDKDAVEITTEVVAELRRRAKASANPDVRKTVNLLPT